MKKTSLIFLSTLCALAANAAVEIAGGSGNDDRPVIADLANGQDVVLLPNETSPAVSSRFKMKANANAENPVFKSITTKPSAEGPKDWVLAFGATIDSNGSDSEYAFNNTGKMSWYLSTAGMFNIRNSAADAGVSKLEMGTITIQGDPNSASGAGVLVETDALFTGTSALFKGTNDNTSGGVVMSIGANNTTIVNVNYNVAKTTFSQKSGLHVGTGSTFTSGKTSTFNFSEASTTLSVGGTFNYGNTATGLDMSGYATIWAKGTMVLDSALKIQSGGVVEIKSGRDEFSSGAAIRKGTAEGGNGRIVLSGGMLMIGSKDAIATDIGLYSDTDSSISISADNSFQSMFFNLNTHLSLILENSAKASFRGIGIFNQGGKTAYANMTIEGFAADSVFFDSNYWWDSAQITATDTDNNVYQKDQLELVAVGEEFAKYGKYVLSVKAIPEPATYAAVFGAMALALAVYRRRK